MTILYAQGDASITAKDLWNTQQDGSGDYLDRPISNTDVLMANKHSIIVDTDVTCCRALSNGEHGASPGGSFTIRNGVTFTVLGMCNRLKA